MSDGDGEFMMMTESFNNGDLFIGVNSNLDTERLRIKSLTRAQQYGRNDGGGS